MKAFLKITALICAVMTLLPFAACTGKPADTTAESTQKQETEATTAAETAAGEETTKAVTAEETTAELTDAETAEPTEKTAPVENVQSWTFDDGVAGKVIGVYCETEPYAEVTFRDLSGAVVLRERAIDKYFYGRFVVPDDQPTHTVYIYAQSEGKKISDPSRPVTLRFSDNVGSGAFIGRDSHVYLSWYRDFYDGQQGIPGASDGERKTYMLGIKKYLHAQLDEVRRHTGKNTKIIILVCTNPATIYHGLQYPLEEGGVGDKLEPTSTTQMAEFLSDDEDIYMLDMRDILLQHTDKLLFMQADSHWTQISAYYGYYLCAQKIKQDFPDTKVYDLEKDFETEIVPSGGDLLNFMGIGGMTLACTATVTANSSDMDAKDGAPTAYVMGDSYYNALREFLPLMFSKIYLNNPPSNPPLYDYTLEDLESKKPDYLFYVWTERNINGGLGMITSSISAANIK